METQRIMDQCVECGICRKDCEFLRRNGNPGLIIKEGEDEANGGRDPAFECSLCGLCTAACPMGEDPASAFLRLRREAVRKGGAPFPEHSAILAYERRGTSRQYSWYALPENCDTIFFPGCTLTGTRSGKVAVLFDHLKKQVPNLGIVLDCCTKPSHDLGREDYFQAMFGEMKNYLVTNSIRNVLVACPNCYKIFSRYGEELAVKTVYEVLAENGLPETGPVSGAVTVHDPCAIRFEEHIHESVRGLIARKGLTISEMAHHGKKTLCCGEGGSVGLLSPDLSRQWASMRQAEAQGRMIITYCAGCANALGRANPTGHILDLLLEPEETMAGKAAVARSPWTYLMRIRLKKRLQRAMNPAVSRERTFKAEEEKGRVGLIVRLAVLLLLIGGVWAVRSAGASNYLDQEVLENLIRGYGLLAPLFYMLVYALAPALFVPGLPITVAGGILFGPFWGVVYAITSSTIGACVAFLISRYLARDWIERKLRSPRWKRLDDEVERHGWKVVALTRLIPLFPFNLLNYAFGLTKVKFIHYAAATFICMLPACIAFIVFASSLPDLMRGKVSPAFIAGICLIVLVSLIPAFYRRRRKSRLPSEEPEVRANGKGEDLS